MKYLTIALTKGRLAGKTMKLLAQAGIECKEMQDPETRKLIFTIVKIIAGNPRIFGSNRDLLLMP